MLLQLRKEEEPVNSSLNLPEGGRDAIHNEPLIGKRFSV